MDERNFKKLQELCKLAGIRTIGELKAFEDCHGITAPNGEQLIEAISRI